MHIDRRDLLTGLGGLTASAALPPAQTAASGSSDKTFPRKSDFAIPADLTYLNGACMHPMPIAAAEAVRLDAHFLRVEPSVYNDLSDIDHPLEALS